MEAQNNKKWGNSVNALNYHLLLRHDNLILLTPSTTPSVAAVDLQSRHILHVTLWFGNMARNSIQFHPSTFACKLFCCKKQKICKSRRSVSFEELQDREWMWLAFSIRVTLYIVSMTEIISRADLHCSVSDSWNKSLFLRWSLSRWTGIIRVPFPLSNCLLIIFVHTLQQEILLIQLLFHLIGAKSHLNASRVGTWCINREKLFSSSFCSPDNCFPPPLPSPPLTRLIVKVREEKKVLLVR